MTQLQIKFWFTLHICTAFSRYKFGRDSISCVYSIWAQSIRACVIHREMVAFPIYANSNSTRWRITFSEQKCKLCRQRLPPVMQETQLFLSGCFLEHANQTSDIRCLAPSFAVSISWKLHEATNFQFHTYKRKYSIHLL